VKLSTESVLPEKIVSISGSAMGFNFSREGEGTSVMLTGSEQPLNQLASLSTFPEFLVGSAVSSGGVRPTSNSAASFAVTLSGEIDRSLLCLRKGRKVEDLVGEDDGVRVKRGGRSTLVLER
jgi:hypothetical protein